MYLGFVFSDALKEARSENPSWCAMASISAPIRSISRSPSWWIWSGVRLLIVVRAWMSLQIAAFAAGQGSDGEDGAAMRGVLGGDEAGECLVGGQHLVIDGVGNLLGEALLVCSGDAAGELLGRASERDRPR